RAYQLARINFVCLRTSRSAIDLHARWIDNVISHAMLYQESMQPESVIACLVAAHDIDGLLQLSVNTLADLVDELKQSPAVAALQWVVADFLGYGSIDRDNPTLLTQLDCHQAAYCPIMGWGGW